VGDSKQLAISDHLTEVVFRSIDTGKETDRWPLGSMCMRLVRSLDGMTSAAVCEDGSIHLWDAASRKETKAWKGNNGRILGVQFSPDGKKIITGSEDKQICIWDAHTCQLIKTLQHPGFAGTVLSISPSGKFLVAADWETPRDRLMIVFDLETGAVV